MYLFFKNERAAATDSVRNIKEAKSGKLASSKRLDF